MSTPQILRNSALALRDEQQMEAAHAAIEQAAKLAPGDPGIAFIRAQIALETGRDSGAHFETARRLDPGNLMLVRNYAASLADAGKGGKALKLLDKHLRINPGWADGHKLRSNLSLAAGQADFTRSYADACRAEPLNLGLRLAWFHLQSLAKNWDRASAIIGEGERLIGERPAFTLARLYIASESGAAAGDAALFDSAADIRDPGLDLCQVRFWLRYGDPVRAEAIATRNMEGASAAAFWPYLSLAWRMTGNAKAEWLDNPNRLIRSYDIPFSADERIQLAETLRDLHKRKAHFLEQSVRGGTQTDGQLFFHHNPIIQEVRHLVINAVEQYIRDLPPVDPAHPTLSAARNAADNILFEGSWSVRLAAQGFHSRHTHVKGWISSALYIDLPPVSDMGPPPAGWLEFGAPPTELNLDMAAYCEIEPVAGRLVLFPSHLWHGTVPFAGGERLTVAFDVRRPRN